jgi:hypothetical protein
MALSTEEQRQIEAILNKAAARERQTATASKNGFLNWLKHTSLGYLVGKLLDLAWSSIRAFFGF